MSSQTKFRFRSFVNRSADEVFFWHLRPRMLERCIPSWEDIEITSSKGFPDRPGSKIAVNAKLWGPIHAKFEFEYCDFVPNESFKVKQTEGFLAQIEYETAVNPQGEHTCEILDQFVFSHRYPKILSLIINPMFKRRLSRLLVYKHEMIDNDLGLIKKYPFKKPLKILIAGSHGLIGKNLYYFLEFVGHDVWHLARFNPKQEKKTIVWDPDCSEGYHEGIEGFDIIINLAGENIGKGRWTQRKKEKILKSRYKGTENLVEIIKRLKNPPKTFINASTIGYYGDQGSHIVREESRVGEGLFISEVCEHWERASRDLEELGVRVVQTRFGVVLSSAGGALKQMLTPFEWGLGGKLGNGHQYISWVSIDDVIGALYHIIMTDSLEGPVNVVSPQPVTNAGFCKKLAKRLKRWVGPPLPDFIIHMLFGQKGDELLLTSTRAEPARLLETGYSFQYPNLSQALEHVI